MKNASDVLAAKEILTGKNSKKTFEEKYGDTKKSIEREMLANGEMEELFNEGINAYLDNPLQNVSIQELVSYVQQKHEYVKKKDDPEKGSSTGSSTGSIGSGIIVHKKLFRW